MEIDDALKISDPLYELGMYKLKHRDSLLGVLADRSPRVSQLYRGLILETFEVNRLNFLRQAGLSFLVFPSATHTRFAHAIGTWNLGNYALEHIAVETAEEAKVGEETGQRRLVWKKLGDWIDGPGRKWREEFFCALLLHDVGHLPFSHVLEGNESLVGFPGHEELGRQLIVGEGPFYKKFEQKARRLRLSTIAEVLRGFDGVAEDGFSFHLSVVLEFLSEKCPLRTQPVKELISGTVDLDRIDHYNRDSYFTGLKLANTNIKGLLENVVLKEVGEKDPQVLTPCILEDGESHLLQLLFSQDLLWRSALDNDHVRGYEAMLNHAVSLAMARGALRLDEVIVMTDEELLQRLSDNDATRDIVVRLLTRKPYELVLKEEIEGTTKAVLMQRLTRMREKEGINEGALLVHVGSRKLPAAWLNLFVLLGGSLKRVDTRHADFVQYLKRRQMERNFTVRVYAQDDRGGKVDKDTLKKYLTS